MLSTEPRTHESLAVLDEGEEDEKGLKHCTEDEEEEEADGEEEPQWNGPGQSLSVPPSGVFNWCMSQWLLRKSQLYSYCQLGGHETI